MGFVSLIWNNDYSSIPFGLLAGEMELTVCEGQMAQIGCDRKVLQINYAFYGRADFTTCVHPSAMKATNCSDPGIQRQILMKCAANSSCDINLYTRDYGDPCPGNYKYIKLRYQCIGMYTY